MKLIRLFGIFILISLVVGIGGAFNGDDYKPIDEKFEVVNDEISFSESKVTDVILDESTNVVDKSSEIEEEKIISTETVDKTKEESGVNEKKEQNVVPKNVEDEQKTESTTQIIPPKENEEISSQKEEKVEAIDTSKAVEVEEVKEQEEIDEELEELKKQVVYSSYEECMKAGFDIAFSDTVNILGFDPIEIIYKGQVIGYKLKIRYTNPMEN